MDKWQYRAQLLDEQRRHQERMSAFMTRHWLLALGMALAVGGIVLVALSFQTQQTDTTTSGHLWWKEETSTTTQVPLRTRLTLLAVGCVLLAAAALAVTWRVRQAAQRATQKKYLAILTGIERMSIHQIAGITGSSSATVYRDVQRMIDTGVIEDVHIDFQAEEAVSKRYVPKTSHKTVVKCHKCQTHNELIIGIPRPCLACGEPLVLNFH